MTPSAAGSTAADRVDAVAGDARAALEEAPRVPAGRTASAPRRQARPSGARPLRVCFLIAGFGGGGAQKQCIHLLNQLQQRTDVELSLVYFHDGVHRHLLRQDALDVRRVRVRSMFNPLDFVRVAAAVRAAAPDVLFSWLQAADLYARGIRALLPGTRWAMAERDSWYGDDWRNRLRRVAARSADLVVSNSAAGDRYWAAHGLPARRRAVVRNILPAGFIPDARSAPPARAVCFAGRLEPQKNVLLVAEAFARLARRRPELSFTMIGEGSQRGELARRLAEARAEDRVQVLPFQPAIRDHFLRAGVFVNMSRHEGTPNTVIENIALGNRVVVSRIPEHIDLLGSDYRFLVDLQAGPEELARVLGRAIASPPEGDEYRHARGRLARMGAAEVADAYVRMFGALVRRGRQ